MQFDGLTYRYPSRRHVVYGTGGMVAVSQPLAAQAGIDALKQGGNAVDAAIAAAACLTVVEPPSNGLGGDAFSIIWMDGKMYGLNSSGPAPGLLDMKTAKGMGHKTMPQRGWLTVTVPGVVGGWKAMSERFGKLPFARLLEPAILYAEKGYPVSPVVSINWKSGFNIFRKLEGPEFAPWFDTFAPHGAPPSCGEVWRSPGHASTLREIADTHGESFYRGALAEKIDAFSRATGGFLRKEDLAAFYPEWVDPIHVNYKGYDVWEIPPNGDGIIALMALNILKQYDFREKYSADALHKQFEAIKMAFADGHQYVADPRSMRVTTDQLLSSEYAAARRAEIGKTAAEPRCGDPAGGGTVYMCTADGDGNMVSFIQSNYKGFGSGIAVPGTGIALQNRGKDFSLDETSDNCLMPGKKPFHTIIPAFLTKDGAAIGPFGVMGGYMQPQGHLQVVMNLVDFEMNPQEALDAPRWQWAGGKKFEVERGFPYAVTEQLVRMGHEISVLPSSTTFGRGQIICRNHLGVLTGATEPRTDGAVLAY